MIKLTKVRKSEPTPKCQKPNPKQTQQSPMISHPKNKSQMEQNDKQIETPKTNGKIMSHDSHKRPPQTQYESASNVCAQPHQTEHLRHVHSSPTTQELKKKMKTQTQHRPHSTKGHQVKESIGGKKIESSNTIENHGLNTTQHSEWEKQENIYESPKEDPTMDHTFEKPNTSKLDHKMKGQGGLKDLVESKDMKNKSHPTNIMSQSVKNENPPQREVKLDGNTQQQSTHVGQSTNSYDRRKLDTSAFQDNELEEKTETQRKSKIEPRGSTSIQHSMASLELCEDLGRKKIGKNLKAHDNKAIESEQRLDNGENEMARQGILHAPEPCVCPSRPHLEAKTSAKNEAKKIIEQNSPNTSEEGELWRKFGHEDLGDINQKIPQAQPKELTRLETGNQFLQQIESHISKEKKLDKRTDIGASIIHRATLQATMMDPEESREEESKVLQCEAHILSPIAKPPTHQSPPRMADQCFTWPREESLLTPRAHDERVGHNLLIIQNMSTTLDFKMYLCRLLHHNPPLQ